MSVPNLSYINQEYQESLVQGKIHNQQITTKTSNIGKAKV